MLLAYFVSFFACSANRSANIVLNFRANENGIPTARRQRAADERERERAAKRARARQEHTYTKTITCIYTNTQIMQTATANNINFADSAARNAPDEQQREERDGERARATTPKRRQ